jgi:hypothetical protein
MKEGKTKRLDKQGEKKLLYTTPTIVPITGGPPYIL